MLRTRASTFLPLLVFALAPPLTGGDIKVDGKFVSTAPNGTPPLQVDSTTLVDNLNAELLNGLPASAFTTSVSNVVRVGKAGAEFTSIQAALDSITDAALDNWYVVRVGPGIYNESVTLKSFVSVIGHEFPATRIEVEGAGDVTAVQGAAISFLSNVLVIARSTDGGGATGISGPLFRIERATVEVETSGSGEAIGFHAQDSTTIIDSELVARNGSVNTGVLMNPVSLVDIVGGGVRAESFSSPGATNYGVDNPGDSRVDLAGVDVSAAGGSVGYGIRLEGTGNTGRWERCVIFGAGSTTSAGVHNGDNSNIIVVDSRVTADGAAATSTGMEVGGGIATIRSSDLSGISAIDVAAGAAARMAYNQIDGSLTGAGDFDCIGLHSVDMSPVNCPSP